MLLTSGPTLISIIPNDGSLLASNDTIHTAPTQLTFRFLLNAGEALNPNTVANGIQLARSDSDGVFGNGNDIHITPGFVGIDPSQPNQVVMRFSSLLPDDLYRITIIGGNNGEVDPLTDTASPALPFNGGQDYTQDFRLQVGPQVLSVVPEPVTRGPSGQLQINDKQIDVYFSGPVQTLPGNGNALDPQQFQLIDTHNTATTADDGSPIYPVSVSYDPSNNEAALTFSTSISTLGSGGAVRLRIGNTDQPLPTPATSTIYPGDVTGTFSGADSIGPLGPKTQIYSDTLSPLPIDPSLVFPGGVLDPGHRILPITGENSATDAGSPVPGNGQASFRTYSFPDVYGTDPTTNQPLHNQITENQKQTVRYIFQLYSYYTGISFKEVPGYSGSDWVVTGDPRVLDPTVPPTAIGGIASGNMAIINGNLDWGASLYGSGFMSVAMHEIGHTLGLPHDDNGPPGTIMNGGAESQAPSSGPAPPPLFPGIADITNLLYGYEPNSNQIDLYQFTANSTGALNAQTVAQALPTQSSTTTTLDTLLTLYEEFKDLNLPASGAQVASGDTFTITDNSTSPPTPVTFEFTSNSAAINPATGKLFSDGHVGVLFSASDTQQDLASEVLNTVGKQGLNVTGTVGLNGVQFAGPITLSTAGSSINGSASRTMIARNDNYYGKDSLLNLNLQPGVYYVAVTAAGNDAFNPEVPNSGWGGQTFGDYQLKLNFQPTPSQPLTDPGASLLVPASLASIPDGYSFTLSDVNASGQSVTETLKFYNGSTAPVSPPPGQISIQLQPTDTQDGVANKIIAAMQSALAAIDNGVLGVTNYMQAHGYVLSYLGNGRIEVGGGSNPTMSIAVDPSGKGALTGTPLILWGDGHADPLAGNSNAGGQGAYNFWFNSGPTIYVDKTAPAGGDGSLAKPYNTIQAALQNSTVVNAAANGQEVNVRVEGNANVTLGIALNQTGAAQILNGETFKISAGSFSGTFEFTNILTYAPGQVLPDGHYAVLLPLNGTAAMIASSIEGSLTALNVALTWPDGGDVMVSDGGSDGHYQYVKLYQGQFPVSVSTQTTPFNATLTGVTVPSLYNNAPYLVGTDQFGNLLPDDSPGNSMLEIPKNVVLMIDAGAVFKLNKANIAVGSSVVNIDKSQSAMQVLGIPGEQVTFTSYNDDNNGTPQIHPGISVTPGDWGGLVFNPDSDLETMGAFLNNVAEAKLSYGGGQVVVNGVQQSFTPLYFDTARPTISNNLIVNSASAAMSGNPNAFENTRFGSDLSIVVTGTPSDGNAFTVGGTTFEFDSNGIVAQGNVAIPLAGLTTLPKLATAIEAAINNTLYAGSVDKAQALGAIVTLPQNLATGANASPLTFTLDTFAVDYQRFGPDVHGNLLSQTLGQTLTAAAGSALKSGTKFVINNAGFELISSGTADAGYIGVNFTAASKAADVAQAIANAINAANLGVAAQWGAGQTTVKLAGAFNLQLPAPLAGTQNIIQNTINGLFIRIATDAGQSLDTLDVPAEFASTDIPYVLQENLVIHDDLGFINFGGTTRQRVAGQLTVDPGVLVKAASSRIEAEMGSNLIAEGTAAQPIVFTSLDDWRYGAGGTFDTPSNGGAAGGIIPQKGDWGGFYFWPTSSGSFDHTLITFGGGSTAIEGGFAPFDAVEIHQAKVRIADSTLESNAGIGTGSDRNGREPADAATIDVLGAQPVIVNNVIQNNDGAAISVDANSLDSNLVPDWGRSTGPIGRYSQFDDNHGPLVRLNKIGGNGINGMLVQGATLETSSIWDDTDIVHVLENEVKVVNFASNGGLRLQSSATQSLVIKLSGASAGFTASGMPLDMSDRIGGEVQVIGTPQHPVVFTSLNDHSVGAGLTPTDQPDNITNGAAPNSTPAPGNWRGLLFDQYSNDRNVAMVNETEPALTGGKGTNDTPASPQSLGQLAPNQQSGDDNLRLGFQVNGYISPDYSQDVDTYTFKGTAGTQLWLNVTNTSASLDAVLELVDAQGNVLARSDNSGLEQRDAASAGDPLFAGPGSLLQQELPGNLAQPLQNSVLGTAGMNFWSTNPRDPGFRVVLPGSAGVHDYYVRVYSKDTNATTFLGQFTRGQGTSSGQYQLQIRLQNEVEIPGSAVTYADIRYATNGIDVEGLPAHSPLVSNSYSSTTPHDSLGAAQNLGDLLTSDTSSINVGGNLTTAASVDWYKFDLTYQQIQVIAKGQKTWATMFDVGYADGLTRPNTIIDVYDASGNLIYTGRDSNVADQQPRPNAGLDSNELNHSSFGTLDPFIGSVQLPAGQPLTGFYTYYVAIHSNATLPQALDGYFSAGSSNSLVRLEPINSLDRIVEDHVGSQGGETAQSSSTLTPMWGTQTDQTVATLNSFATPYNLSDVVLFVSPGGVAGHLETINPFTGALETDQGRIINSSPESYPTIAMRNDGRLFGLSQGSNDGNSGNYAQIDTGTGAANQVGDDGVATEFIQSGGTSITGADKGVQYNAMAFVQQATGQGNTPRQLYAIGSYNPVLNGTTLPFDNGIYQLDPNTGAVVPPANGGINAVANPVALPTQPLPVYVRVNGVKLTSETITGMAYLNGTMYAVGDGGGLYRFSDIRSGQATLVTTFGGVSFTSLTAGPPDVENGRFKDMLFAAGNGNLYAFNTSGQLQNVFSNGQSSISLGGTAVAGMAFSTLDYNLWHVTKHRGADPATTAADQGHGIIAAPDNSRTQFTPNPPSKGGGQSFYFGLENPPSGPSAATDSENSLSQPDAGNYTTNSGLYDTYNLPGGAYGSLSTNSFSLANYAPTDKPTLYFNYFLNTEDAQSTQAKLQQMFDSARVLVSEDGGTTWDLLATNNYYTPSDVTHPEAELPYYQSVSSETGSLNSLHSPLHFGHPAVQQVQQLFDKSSTSGTGTGWRQARVDLSDYAGQNNLQLRFDFSTAGTTFNPGDLLVNAVTGAANPYANQNVYGNQFGQFQGANNNGNGPEHRGLGNNHEGWYIDDIVIGLAGRGEMVTNPNKSASANTNYDNLLNNPFSTPTKDPNPAAPQQLLTGPYQLEIRRGTEYGSNFDPQRNDIALYNSFNYNDRLTQAYSIVAPAGSGLSDGETFTVSDGVHSVTFEFDDNGAITTGNWPISFQPSYTAQQVADAIVSAVDSNPTLVGVSASDVNNQANAAQGVSDPATNIVDLFGVTEISNVNTSLSTLRVVLGPPITESSTNNVGTLIRSGTNLPAITVNLSAIDVETGAASTNVSYPATVSFSAGQTLATFFYSGVVKGSPWADGTRTVKFTASYPGFTSYAGTVDVTDDPGVLPQFTVSPLGSIAENSLAPVQGSVTVNTGPVDANQHPGGLVVNLSSLWPDAALVSASAIGPGAANASVTILPGQTSANFWVFPQDDNVKNRQPNPFRNAQIVATAAGVISGNAMLTVKDDTDGTIPYGVATWTAIGPAPIASGQVAGGLPVSGRITGIAADPTNANTIFVSAAGGGVWKTTNGGTSWTPLTDNLTDSSNNPIPLFMGAIAVAPSNHLDLYAGTGEANNAIDSYYGSGILVSKDGGNSWTLQNAGGALAGRAVAKIAVDPTNPNVAYAAVDDFAVNGKTGNTGIWKTIDGGNTWTNTTTALGSTFVEYTDVVVDPNKPNIVYAAIGTLFGGAANGVYKSTDGGNTWNLLNGSGSVNGTQDGRIVLALYDDGATSKLFISISDTSGSKFGQLYKMLESTDGGATFTDLTANVLKVNNFLGTQGWYDTTLAVDPKNSNYIYAAGQMKNQGPTFTGSPLESFDGGATWTDIATDAAGNGPHTDAHAVAFDASGNLFDGDDGGIFKLTNPTDSINQRWSSLNSNLSTIQFNAIALDPTDPTVVLGGSQDNGTERYSNNPAWTLTDFGDGGTVRFDPQDASIAYHIFDGGFFMKSTDGGQTWNPAVNGLKNFGNQNFYPPFTVAPSNGNEVLLGDNTLWITTDAAANWKQLTTVGAAGWNPSGDPVDSIAIAPSDSNAIYAATGGSFASSSQIFESTDGGANWTEVDLPVGSGRVNQLLIDPTNSQIAYAVVNVFTGGGGHVFRTANGGATWSDISGNLPDEPTNAIAINSNTGDLYVGDDTGVYVSYNLGASWENLAVNLPYAQVVDLQYNPAADLLGVATHGRGAFLLPAPSTGGTALTLSINGAAQVSDDAGLLSGELTVTRSGKTGKMVVSLTSSNPSVASVPATVTIPDGLSSVSVNVTISDSQSAAGPQSALFTASTASLGSIEPVGAMLDVLPYSQAAEPNLPSDNDTPALSLSIPAVTMVPGTTTGTLTATVTRNTPTTNDLVVHLLSLNPSAATVQPTVVIPAGQTSATFTVSAVDLFTTSTSALTGQIVAAADGLLSATGIATSQSADAIQEYNSFIMYDFAGGGAQLAYLRGDATMPRPQGEVILYGNQISNASQNGILVRASAPGTPFDTPTNSNSNLPHPGALVNTPTLNGDHLAPGVVITNNLIYGVGQSGISFQGNNDSGAVPGAVPFGRIVNNTIYGGDTRTGVGINVANYASPTILNNILVNLSVGIQVDASSQGATAPPGYTLTPIGNIPLWQFQPPVVGENFYQNNGTDANPGGFRGVFASTGPAPFRNASIDPTKANFYLVNQAVPIDSSLNSLQDRTSMTSVTAPLGIAPSPIIAPAFDLYGQLRVDDPTVTNANLGTGQNVFIDRGAIEHADTTGPTAALLAPVDNDQSDLNKAPNIVFVRGQSLSEFTIQLSDGSGSGIYDASVNANRLDVREDGRLLTPNVDYYFDYDNNNHIIHLVAASGVWLNGHQYDIYLDNGLQFDPGNSAAAPVGIADRAGNFLQANGPDGLTHFRLLLANLTNSAPVVQLVSSGTGTPSLAMYENDNATSPTSATFSLTTPFSSADNTSVALSIFDVDANGGSETLTLTATHGTLTLSSAALTELNSIGVTPTGQGTSTITITAPLGEASAVAPTPGLNAALEGLVFTPDLNFDSHLGDQAVITVSVDDLGKSPPPALTTTYSIPINVIAVNDPPADTVPASSPASPILRNEDNAYTFSKAGGNPVSVADSDITAADANNPLLPPFEEIITVNPSAMGALALTNVAGVTFTGGTSNGQSKLDFLGTLSAINQALDGLVFQPAEELTGAVQLTFTTNDHGNIGVGPAPQYLPGPQALTSAPQIVYLNVQQVVDAPTLNVGAKLAFQSVAEDTPSAANTGSTVIAMLQSDPLVQPNAITLNAPGSQYGIAVVAATGTAHGVWQYKSPVSNWTPFPTVATNRALLIDAADSVRFLPDPKFDDTRGPAPTLSFVAWDHTYDLLKGGPDVDGAVLDLTKTGTGGSTPFSLLSSGTATATLAVTPAAEAPTLASAASLAFQSVNEDVLLANNNGSSVLSMLQSDPSYQPNAITLHAAGTPRYGIAVTGLTQTANGVWQYQIGGGWANIPLNVSATSALLLDGNDLVRFLPNPKFDNTRGGAPTLSFVAWDETFDYVNGLYDADGSTVNLTLTGQGGSTPFSSNSAIAKLSVVPQPEAPALNSAAALSFASILEDLAPANNLGTTVIAMLQSDPNSQPNAITLNAAVSPQYGIAVVGLGQTANGTWQYQLPGGNWTAFPSVSATSALLLDGGDLIRFLPKLNFNDFYGGAPTVSFVAWDETFDYVNGRVDVHGQTVDLTATGTGGSTPFSSGAADSAKLSVKAVNDPPVVSGPASVALSPSTAFALSTDPMPAYVITDPDLPEGNQQMQAAVSTSENGVAGGAVGLTQLTGITIVSGANNSANVTFKGSITNVLAALANLVYEQDINFNGTASLTLIANDLGNSGLGPQGQPAPFPLSSAPLVVTLTGVPIHRAPALGAGSPTLPAILENVPPVNTPPTGTTISAMLAAGGANYLSVDTAAGGQPGIAVAGMSTGGGGVWQFSADGSTWTTIASASPSQAVLLPASYQIRFWPNPGYAGVASITFYAWDQVTGTAGTTVDLTGAGATGGFTSFSTASGTATLNVKLVNQPPLFTLASNDSVLENNTVTANGGSPGGSNAAPISLTNFVTGISPGQPIESQPPFSQTVTFTVSTDRPDLFLVQPTLDPAAPGATSSALHFQLNPDVFGAAKISVVAHDNGGTANGGNDTSTVATTTLVVALINDPPSLNPIPNQTILENAARQTLNLSGIASGLGESQNLTVTATSDQPGIVPNPTINYTSPNGSASLQYQPVAFASGVAHITVTVHDDGGTANGGIDAFSQTFTVNVQFVNQAPSFVKGPDEAANEDSGLQIIPGWATQISPGLGNGEVNQGLNFIVTPDNPNFFAIPPSIDPATGALRYQFAPNFSGSSNVNVKLHDNGGTANGGHDASATQTFKLTANFVNDIPTFAAGSDQTVNENAPAQSVAGWASAISPGVGFNEAGQTLNFQVSTNNPSLFAAGPSIDPTTGTLTYTPALNAFGTATVTVLLHDNGGTANGGIDTSLPQTFAINVNFVNHAPSFVVGPNQVVNENAPLQTIANWAKQISAGPSSESGETLSFIVTNDNPALFSTPPSIDPATGTLTYQPAAFAAGASTVTVKLKDDGGTANGGVDTSPAQTFKITVNFVNQAPSFTIGSDQLVNENSPPQTVPNFATNISPGPGPKEVGQALNFLVTTDNNALFSTPPTIDAMTGALRYAVAPGATGTANVTVQLHDNGGTANGGNDTSIAEYFKISSLLINHAPSFLFLGGDQYVNENSGAHQVANFVSQLSPGPANESGQTLNFQVSNDNHSLFTVQPSLDVATGALSYTVASNAYGSATVTIALHDNGGTANGGVDTSATQSFKIFVFAPPVAQPDFLEISYAQTSSSTAAIGVLSNDTDPNGVPLSAALVSGPAHGALLLHADGSFNYTPGADFEGLDQFTYMASDGHSNSNVATVRIYSHDADNVRKLYEQVLHRDPDDAGMQFWTNLIQNGSSLAVVAQGIIESDERLDPIITGYYQQFLLRTPDAAGLAFWRDQVWKAFGGPEPVIAGMLSSPEFFQSAGGTDQAWVEALYHRLLNRTPDPQGLQNWINLLDSHQATEMQVAHGFLSSDEYYTNLIDGFFAEYLNRQPTADELHSDLVQMRAGVSDRDIQLEIVVTDEYKNTPPPPPLGAMKRLTH